MKINDMTRIWLIVILMAICTESLFAQSDYITYSEDETEAHIDDLRGNGGIYILSHRNDLVVTIANANNYQVRPTGVRKDGLYGYEVVLDKDETNEARVEVSKRGDVYRTSFVVRVRPDYFRAYRINEVKTPIRMEDQTQVNDAILNADLAEVEFTTSIEGLHVECPKELQAKITTRQNPNDKSIFITSVVIPIKVLNEAQDKMKRTAEEYEALRHKLIDEENGSANVSERDWERLDYLDEQAEKAADDFHDMTRIHISAIGTNRLQVEVSGLKPRIKLRYGVLLLTTERIIDEFSAKIAEGARLYSLRDYEGAQRSFRNALNLKDAPNDLKPTVKTNIIQCDSCILYERYAAGALDKMKKSDGQDEVVRYASAAKEYIQVLNRYNPNDFYSSRLTRLDEILSDIPLMIKFTIVKWINNYAGFKEGGKMPNVEVWANFGNKYPGPNDYRNDRKFRNLVGSSDYRQVGVSDENGELELQLNRNVLPTGLFFRPKGYQDHAKITYMDVKDILNQSEGTYNKRQFRLKMYFEN